MEEENKSIHKNKVHGVLAHSYLFYFVSFLVGLFLDFIFPFKIFKNPAVFSVGCVFLVLGTLLILWAQRASQPYAFGVVYFDTGFRNHYQRFVYSYFFNNFIYFHQNFLH